MSAAPRYTVRTDKISPRFRVGLCAWINDANHPDDPIHGASISWHSNLADAHRVCNALNATDSWVRALRAQFGEAA